MKTLFIKELKSIFCSSTGIFFAFVYLLGCGLMLWFFSGNFNIFQNGYASLICFFKLSPILFLILIPALTMRFFAEEKRTKTLDILFTRPVYISSIYFSKFLAISLFILIVLASTTFYIYTLYQFANPIGNIDIHSIIISYISLYCISLIFTSIGLFTSTLNGNQITALLLSILICFFSFYGFDLLADLFSSGKTQFMISSFGLSHHYKLMLRGVFETKNLIVIFNYVIVFYVLALFFIKRSNIKIRKYIFLILVLNIIFLIVPNIRFDFTPDKRYTLSDYSKKILSDIKDHNKKISVNIYLDGELNAGFQYLRNSTEELISDFNNYGNNCFDIKFINPYVGGKDHLDYMTAHNMPGIMLTETNREGKVSQKTIYPYAQIVSNKDTLIVSLLKNIPGYTADENLNVSAENLEFEFIDAISILNQKKSRSIAFIEGHHEWSQEYVYDAEELLSKYYTINRGQIGNNVSDLNEFEAIIIAGPINQFTETEKYIIDQYIMNGGKVLWLVDGVYYSEKNLALDGYSASIKNNSNLDDLLFSYGVRINSNILQDTQCSQIFIVTEKNKNAEPALIPCYYMPILIPSYDHPITRNIRDVKSAFGSSIDIVNSSNDTEKKILLTTSDNSHIIKVPEPINYEVTEIQANPNYFDQSFIPLAVSLEGVFNSAFTNRQIPPDVVNDKQQKKNSKPTRMIVVSSSRIIVNEVKRRNADIQILPMGYDINSGQQFGNRDFIVNAVNWLTDMEDRMNLRIKQQNAYTLNRKTVYEKQNIYGALNIGIPILFMFLLMGSVFIYRKRKYNK